ncbi:MAG: TraK family protein [Aquabacterium sp.]|jgi:cytochrome c-type biogenesis protein CcmH/NrfF|uniref:TraK family protein n=1 Tax=Aquabacterium sp. TaxID=1872578 RepID=UPI003BAF8A81
MNDSERALLDAMAGWACKNTEKDRRSSSLAVFMALREDVKTAMDAGYSRRTIWEFLTDTQKVPFTYGTFIRYVKEHITDSEGRQ